MLRSRKEWVMEIQEMYRRLDVFTINTPSVVISEFLTINTPFVSSEFVKAQGRLNHLLSLLANANNLPAHSSALEGDMAAATALLAEQISSLSNASVSTVPGLVSDIRATLVGEVQAVLGQIYDSHQAQQGAKEGKNMNSNEVFVVHGHNHDARDAVHAFVRALGLKPIEWETAAGWTQSASPNIYDVIIGALKRVQAVIVVMSGDEHVSNALESEVSTRRQSRPNVIFEAGMAFAICPKRTLLLNFGKNSVWSDLGGITYVDVNGDDLAKFRSRVVTRLKSAGCDPDTTGTDWLSDGDFQKALDISIVPVSSERTQELEAEILELKSSSVVAPEGALCPNCSTSSKPHLMSPVGRSFQGMLGGTHQCPQCKYVGTHGSS